MRRGDLWIEIVLTILLVLLSACGSGGSHPDGDLDADPDGAEAEDAEPETGEADETEAVVEPAFLASFSASVTTRYVGGNARTVARTGGGFWAWGERIPDAPLEDGCRPASKTPADPPGLDNGPVRVSGGYRDFTLTFDERSGLYTSGDLAGADRIWSANAESLQWAADGDGSPGAFSAAVPAPDSLTLLDPDPTDTGVFFRPGESLTVSWSSGTRGRVRLTLADAQRTVVCGVAEGKSETSVPASVMALFDGGGVVTLSVERVGEKRLDTDETRLLIRQTSTVSLTLSPEASLPEK